MEVVGYDKIVELRNKKDRENQIQEEIKEEKEKKKREKKIKFKPELVPPQNKFQLYNSQIYDPKNYMYNQYQHEYQNRPNLSHQEIKSLYSNALPGYSDKRSNYQANNFQNIDKNNVHLIDHKDLKNNDLYKIQYANNQQPIQIKKDNPYEQYHPIVQEILELGQARVITPKKEEDGNQENQDKDSQQINVNGLNNLKLQKPLNTNEVYKIVNKYTGQGSQPKVLNQNQLNNNFQNVNNFNNMHHNGEKQFYTFEQFKVVHMNDEDIADENLSWAQREQLLEIKYMDYKLKNQYDYQKKKDYARFEYRDQVPNKSFYNNVNNQNNLITINGENIVNNNNSNIMQQSQQNNNSINKEGNDLEQDQNNNRNNNQYNPNYFSNYQNETINYSDLLPIQGMPQDMQNLIQQRSQPILIGQKQKKLPRFRTIPVIPKYNMYEQK